MVHPWYNAQTHAYDLMLVEIELVDNVVPIRLNPYPNIPSPGVGTGPPDNVTAIGFGYTHANATAQPTTLQKVTMPFVPTLW